MADNLQSSLTRILQSVRSATAASSENLRTYADQNNSSVQRILKDIHRVFTSNARQNATINSSIEESVSETQRFSGKIDGTNNLLQQTLSIQSVMLSELKSLNGGIRSLINASFNNNRGLLGGGGLGGAAVAALGAGGAAWWFANRNNQNNNNTPPAGGGGNAQNGGGEGGGTDLRGQNLTRGMRRNNPTNLIYVGQPGALPPPNEGGEPQAVFASIEEGLSAGARQALLNYNRKGLKTSRQMMDSRQGGWAEDRNAPQTMASGLGVGLDDDLDLNNPEKLEKFLRQLVKQEQGSNSSYVPDAAYKKAVDSALGGSRVNSQQRQVPQQTQTQPQQRGASPQVQRQSQQEQPQAIPQPPRVERASINPEEMRLPRSPERQSEQQRGQGGGRVFEDQMAEAQVRKLPVSPKLKGVLETAAMDAGVDVRVKSGGQPSSGPNRVGSTRHDDGNAADLDLYIGNRKLSPNNPEDLPIFKRFVAAAKSAGATGIGAGEGYMAPDASRLHVGFGSEAIWGAGGKSANAADWLREAVYGNGGNPNAQMQPNQNRRSEILSSNPQQAQYGSDPNDPSKSTPMNPDQQSMPPMQTAAYNPAIDGNLFGSALYNPMAARFSWPLQVLAEYGGRMLRA